MTFKAICFDLDGVIIDSETNHFQAFARTLMAHGHELSHQEYMDHFAGKTDLRGFKDYAAASDLRLDIAMLLPEKESNYLSSLQAGVTAYPATLSILPELRQHFALSVVTGSLRTEVEQTLRLLNIADYFPVVITGDDVLLGKPDPEGYLKAAEKLGIDPAHCIGIEDSPSGVRAVKRAGMHCLALSTTHSASDLREADSTVGELSLELFKSIESLIKSPGQ
jgi:HAD superfamily hydrolase (TIGR01509 family)